MRGKWRFNGDGERQNRRVGGCDIYNDVEPEGDVLC
jgi:hypothetical protein